MVLINMTVFSYAASDDAKSEECDMWQVIAKTPDEQELLDTGRYALFKMVHKLYNIIDPETDLNKMPIPEFKKNAEPKLYLVFRNHYATSPSDICMLWGRIRLKRWTCEQEQKISFLFREKLKVIHQSYYSCYACYEVVKVEDDSVLKQLERAHEKGRLIRDITEEWNLLSLMYKREQNIKWLSAHMQLYEIKEEGAS